MMLVMFDNVVMLLILGKYVNTPTRALLNVNSSKCLNNRFLKR